MGIHFELGVPGRWSGPHGVRKLLSRTATSRAVTSAGPDTLAAASAVVAAAVSLVSC